MQNISSKNLPIPSFFDKKKVKEFWRVPYLKRASQGENWAKDYDIKPSEEDTSRVCLLLIDVQNTFCLPEFELFVAGRSQTGAIDDNIRLCEFIYRNLGKITNIAATLDTHRAMQIFHPIFWINDQGNHPTPGSTIISVEDVQNGIWKINPKVVFNFNKKHYSELEKYAIHYVKKLEEQGKFPLTVWPYHSMLGGIGHALVSSIEESLFFHNIVRHSQTHFEIKGEHPLTENYSVLSPEILEDPHGQPIAEKNTIFLKKLLKFDKLIITGQAKSHCVAWTIADLLSEISAEDPSLARKIYLLEDCTSAVVVPGVVDFTDQANEAFDRFANAGMNIVKSTDNFL